MEAAAVLGYVYAAEPDPYRLPPIFDKDIARPVFDLGCLDGETIREPRGPYRRGGPGGGGGGDDNDDGGDAHGAGNLPPGFHVDPEDHCAVLRGDRRINDVYAEQG